MTEYDVVNNRYNMLPGSVCYENVINLKKIIDVTQDAYSCSIF